MGRQREPVVAQGYHRRGGGWDDGASDGALYLETHDAREISRWNLLGMVRETVLPSEITMAVDVRQN